ncbi:MAG: translocation/assembly module TamB [Aeromonadales bacterium]|nr:translocation/assembly module TamB [Aeromonadales bacterium]
MKLKRILLGVLAALLLLLALLAGLLFTQTGNQWLWSLTKHQVAGLEGTLKSGQLGHGWKFSELSYEQDSLAFSAKEVTFGWQLSQLFDRRFLLQQLIAEDIEVTIKDLPAAEKEQESEPLAEFSPPLRIDLDDIRADRVKIILPGQTIAWQSLQLAVHWDDEGMVLTGPNMAGLTLPLADNEEAAKAEDKTGKAAAAPIVLPEVALPFPIKIQNFSLTDSQLIQGGEVQALHALILELEGKGSEITITTGELDHEFANLSLTGQVTLTDDYPLELALEGVLKKPLMEGQLEGQTISLALSDSLAHLNGQLALGKVIEAKGQLEAEPLNPELPFDITLNWQQLGWPLDKPQWQLKQGEVKAKGRLEDYQLTLTTEGQGPDLPPLGIHLAVAGDLQGADIKPLTVTLPKGSAEVAGHLSWENDINWQGILTLNEVDPGAFVAGMDGDINGKLDSRFALQGEQWQLAMMPDIHGQLRDFPLELTGNVELDQALHGKVQQLLLKNGKNQLLVNGQMSDTIQLDAKLEAPTLAVYAPGLTGDLAGDIRLRGRLDAPQLEASLNAKKIGYEESEARELQLNAKATLGENMQGDVKLTVDRIRSGDSKMNNLELSASGSEASHRVDFRVNGDPLAAQLALTGSLNKQGKWQGQLRQGKLDTPLETWSLQQPLVMTVQDERFSAQPHCWDSGRASLCFDAIRASAKQGEAGVRIRDLDLARLKPFFPKEFAWEAILNGRADVTWKDGAPKVNANISTTPGHFVSGGTRLAYQTLSLNSDMVNNRLQSALQFRSTQLGQLNLTANVAELDGRRGLSGNLSIDDLKLDWLAPLLPEVARLEGTLAGQGRLEGTLEAPLLFGQISLTGGEVDTYSDMVEVRDLSTRLDIKGTNASIDGQLKVGGGPLTISGELDWKELPVSGEIRLQGDRLEAGYPGMGRVRVSPNMRISLGEEATIRGDILIPWARIEVKELPESAVHLSSDVVIVQPTGIIPEEVPSLPIHIRLQVRIEEDVQLKAFGLDTKLEGRLRIVQEPDRAMRGTGEIHLVDGKFKAYGQNLLIREGSILFSGPLDEPNLQVEAIRNPATMSDSGVTVGVRVTGTASQPELEVFSDPTMPQVEQLSYLLTGHGLDGEQADGNALLQSMLLGAGVSKFGGVVSNVGEALGLQDVTIDTEGSGDDTEVNISAYVLPGLQIGYGVGVFSSIGELRLRYELLPRLYLQAASGLNQAIDLLYRFNF